MIYLRVDTYKAVFDFPLTKMICSHVQLRVCTLTEGKRERERRLKKFYA